MKLLVLGMLRLNELSPSNLVNDKHNRSGLGKSALRGYAIILWSSLIINYWITFQDKA